MPHRWPLRLELCHRGNPAGLSHVLAGANPHALHQHENLSQLIPAQGNALLSEFRGNSCKHTGALIDLHIDVVADQILDSVSDTQFSVGIILRFTDAVDNIATGTIDITYYCRFGCVYASTISVEHQGICSNLINPPKVGVSSGTSFWLAINGFLIAGVLLPVAAIVAEAISGYS